MQRCARVVDTPLSGPVAMDTPAVEDPTAGRGAVILISRCVPFAAWTCRGVPWLTMQSMSARIAVLVFAACTPLAASHLVTGNGFGFAVVAPESGSVTKFYAHPY